MDNHTHIDKIVPATGVCLPSGVLNLLLHNAEAGVGAGWRGESKRGGGTIEENEGLTNNLTYNLETLHPSRRQFVHKSPNKNTKTHPRCCTQLTPVGLIDLDQLSWQNG